MRKGKATRPFRPPRQSVDRSVHAEPRNQTNPEPQVIPAGDSDEPTQFGLVRGSWIVKETQELVAETNKDQIETVLVPAHTGKSVLTDKKWAAQIFNARKMYVLHKMDEWLTKHPAKKDDTKGKKVCFS